MNGSLPPAVDAAQAFARAEAAAVSGVVAGIDETFLQVAGLVRECSGRVVVTGIGTSGFIARRAAHLFSVTGTPSFFLDAGNALHGSLGALREGDVLIALSKGGNSSEVNDVVARAAANKAVVVAVTSTLAAPLAGLADVTVVLAASTQADPGGMIAMGSSLAYGAWLDAVAVVVMRARPFNWTEVHQLHPGGAVGQVPVLPEPLPPLRLPPISAQTPTPLR